VLIERPPSPRSPETRSAKRAYADAGEVRLLNCQGHVAFACYAGRMGHSREWDRFILALLAYLTLGPGHLLPVYRGQLVAPLRSPPGQYASFLARDNGGRRQHVAARNV
jgi:hypothetical protein